MRSYILLLALALALTACASSQTSSNNRPPKPADEIRRISAGSAPTSLTPSIRTENPAVTLLDTPNQTLINIAPAAIGSATLTRLTDRWPPRLTLRIHSTGLESLTISAANLKLAASYSSHPDHTSRAQLWKSNIEGPPLTPDSPYWLALAPRNAASQSVTHFPLTPTDYFETQIPAALLEDQPKTITIHWIDFYR